VNAKKEQPDPWEELKRFLEPIVKVLTEAANLRENIIAVTTRISEAHKKKEGLVLDADEVKHLLTLIALLDSKAKK
jgi:hypothetical protein